MIGKDKVDAALQSVKKKQEKKKYEGYALTLTYPEHILIILPKVNNNQIAPKMNYEKLCLRQKEEEDIKIKKMFYITLQEW